MVEEIYLSSVIKRFSEQKNLGDKTFEQLNDDEINFSPNEDSNSIAVIVQHMHGNMLSRWTNFLTEDGEKEWRIRDEEFHVQQRTKEEIIDLWNKGWAIVLDTLSSLTKNDLTKNITIRSQPLNVVDAINRQLAHYSYHVGQIVYVGKFIRSGNWQSLSIPKGASKDYNRQIGHQHNL